MATRFVPVPTTTALDALLERSHQQPVLLFKHDPYCSISSLAHDQLARLGGEIPWIDVADDRDVARAATERTGIRHESPQVILLRDGKAVWSASHFDITTSAVEDATSARAS
jgi:bacillithiol system protein YtxJ